MLFQDLAGSLERARAKVKPPAKEKKAGDSSDDDDDDDDATAQELGLNAEVGGCLSPLVYVRRLTQAASRLNIRFCSRVFVSASAAFTRVDRSLSARLLLSPIISRAPRLCCRGGARSPFRVCVPSSAFKRYETELLYIPYLRFLTLLFHA